MIMVGDNILLTQLNMTINPIHTDHNINNNIIHTIRHSQHLDHHIFRIIIITIIIMTTLDTPHLSQTLIPNLPIITTVAIPIIQITQGVGNIIRTMITRTNKHNTMITTGESVNLYVDFRVALVAMQFFQLFSDSFEMHF